MPDSETLRRLTSPSEDEFKTVRRRKEKHPICSFGCLKRIAVNLSTMFRSRICYRECCQQKIELSQKMNEF